MKNFLKAGFYAAKNTMFQLLNKIEIFLLRKKKPAITTVKENFHKKKRILILGIYMADKKNFASCLVREFAKSELFIVKQAWVSIGESNPKSRQLREVTFKVLREKVPKFILLNRLLAKFNLNNYDYILFTDDDIVVERGFIDKYFFFQSLTGFSLAQPARTIFSELSHRITKIKPGSIARETRFVEIGPLFSMEKAIYSDLLPFDESSPMGWGYDFVWPVIIIKKGLTMGIIDGVPVNHSIRPNRILYSGSMVEAQMNEYLSKNTHLSPLDAFVEKRFYKK